MKRLLAIAALVLIGAGCTNDRYPTSGEYVFNYTYHHIVYGDRQP